MSKINTAEIVLKSANVDDIKNRANKIKISTEKITDEYKKLKGPNNCGLYGDNLNNLRKAEVSLNEKITVVSEAYVDFEDALSKFETSEAKIIADIKVPKIVDFNTKGSEPVTEPNTTPEEPHTGPQITPVEPPTGPQITPPSSPDPTNPSTPQPPKGGETIRVEAPGVGTGIKKVTITSPNPEGPQPPQEPTPPDQYGGAFAEPPSEMPTMPEPPSEPTPPEPTPPEMPEDGLQQPQPPTKPEQPQQGSAGGGINDQVEIPLVEKSNVEPVKEKSHDGIILAGGIAAVGGLAFGAVQGISALEKKNEDDEEKEKKKKDGKFVIKNEGDR